MTRALGDMDFKDLGKDPTKQVRRKGPDKRERCTTDEMCHFLITMRTARRASRNYQDTSKRRPISGRRTVSTRADHQYVPFAVH